ncbi:MAG: MOSC domain-containing protein [Bacteroidota bacterium]|jgi:uncharacterized protein YcbX
MESLDSAPSVGDKRLGAIYVYPIKSLDRLELSAVSLGPGNSLLNDRRFAIRNAHGVLVNGKRNPFVHRLRCRFANDASTVFINSELSGRSGEFELSIGNDNLNAFLSSHFCEDVTLIEDVGGRFLDDPDDSAITLISEETLRVIADWYHLVNVDEATRRLRPNLVMTGFSAFEEDSLSLDADMGCEFRLGALSWRAIKTCPRCVVPSRHPDTAAVLTGFQKTFVENRSAYRHASELEVATGHLYHASVCCIPAHRTGADNSLVLGDVFSLLS